MATSPEELRRLRDDSRVRRLMQTFRDQVGSAGRAHHRALLKEMRAAAANPVTEPLQELALTVKGKLRLFASKTRGGDATAAPKTPAAGETLAYFPGCLTTESAREYDASIRMVARAAGLALEEIDDWNCCGAGVVQDVDPAGAAALVRRNVAGAGLSRSLGASAGRTIVSGCPVCIARTQEAAPDASATHLLGILTRPDVLAKIAARILKGEKPASIAPHRPEPEDFSLVISRKQLAQWKIELPAALANCNCVVD